MPPCRLILVLFFLGLLASPASAPADEAAVPRISSVLRRVVFVRVPPGYSSVTLQQRDRRNAKTWRILATKRTSATGGMVGIVLRRAVPRRGLFVFGTRAEPANENAPGKITKFLADPALALSSGFSGIDKAIPGGVAMARATADAATGGVGAAASREVAESDIWRLEGDRLYFFNQLRGLQVFDIENPDAPILLGQLREPNRGEQMYLFNGDHVALLTRASYFFSLANRPFSLAKNSATAYDAASGAIVIANVAAGKPGEVARVSYPGYLVESRLVGTALYLVSQVYDNNGQGGLQVTSYDLSDPASPELTDSLALGSYGGVISATDRFLFVARASEDWRHSIIEVVDISAPDGTLAKCGEIPVAGQVPDKFKLNLSGDTLAVVSAVPRNWSGDWNAPGNLPRTMVETFSLARPDAPEALGSIELGVGETVHATRFSGDRLYVVTFLTIDPLWVVDLADPRNPTLLGELEIPGFSTYIEPLGDRLVAVGRVDSRTAVSLFDVSDPSAPALLSQLPLGDGYSQSEANWDEKAFSVFPEQGLILVPYSGYDRGSGWASRIQLIDLGRDALAKRGVVEQGFAARRTAVVDDRILAISASDLVTVNFADRDRPVVTSDVEIAWRVDRVFLSGGYVVEIGGSADWTRAAPPSLTVATADDPDATVNLIELEDAPVTGATVRDGKLYLAQQDSDSWLPVYRLDATAATEARSSTSPLILSVFDLSALPEITRIGRTEVDVGPGYGYGAAQLEPAWPDDDTLVWVREEWSSWWWYDSPMMARGDVAVSATGPMPLAPSGSVALANANLEVAGATTSNLVAAERTVAGDAGIAASSLAAGRIIAPWYRTATGHEMVVFDVSDATAPKYTAKVDSRIGQTGDWSEPVAHDGKLYLSFMAYEDAAARRKGDASRRYRHFVKSVDFSDPENPVVSEEVNIPGRLLSVAHDGTTLLTVGCGYGTEGDPTRSRAFHTSRFDGKTATLVDQIRSSSPYDPYTMGGDTLFTGLRNPIAGGVARIKAWRIGDDGSFELAGRTAAATFSRFDALNGLLVAYGDGLPQVFDASDPANLHRLDEADTRELTGGDLSAAAGGAGLGIWQAQGNSGVGVVRLGR